MEGAAGIARGGSGCSTIVDVQRLSWKLVPYLLRRSLFAALDDGCFAIAKGAAYSALLSFFPVLTTAATVLVQSRAQFVSNTLVKFLSQAVPPGTEDLVVRQFQVKVNGRSCS